MSTQYLNFLGNVMPVTGAPKAWLDTTAANQTLTAGTTNTSLSDSYTGGTMIAGSGSDTFGVADSNEKIIVQPGSGIDTINAWNNFVLPANVQNLTLEIADRTGMGNNLNNLMIAAASDDTLIAGTGYDVLVDGGPGSDTFSFGATSTDNVIYGFQTSGADHDVIQLPGSSISTFSQIQADLTQQGADALLTLSPTQAILIRNTSITALTAADFSLPIETAGVTPAFDGEFNSLSLYNPNTGQGTYKTNYWFGTQSGSNAFTSRTLPVNGEQEIYVDPSFAGTGSTPLGLDPFSVNNGVLTITASLTPAADLSALSGYTYTSGLLTTEKSFSQLYGYFEIKAELPAGQGVWPAFWLIPSVVTGNQELDIFEQLGGSTIYQTAHYEDASGNKTFTSFEAVAPTATTGMNTYGLLWTKTELTWYIDGVATASMATPADMDTAMYMVMNLAIGGTWGGMAPSTLTSAQMEIDYVRAYSLASLGLDVNGNPIAGSAKSAPVSPAPVITSTATQSGQAVLDNATIAPFAHMSIAESDGGSRQETVAVTLSNSANGTFTAASLAASGFTANASTHGEYDFTGTTAQATTALDQLVFQPTAHEVAPGSTETTTFTVSVNDGFTTVNNTATTLVVTAAPLTPAVDSDFAGAGAADILWQNTDGQLGLWLSAAGTAGYSFTSMDLSTVDSSWSVQGIGDFNGDAKSDILWRNSNGDVGLWLSNSGSGYAGFTGVDLGITSNSWTIEGVGDFNGNGKAGVLWENSDGEVGIWLANAGGGYNGFTSQTFGVIPTSWSISGVGDFNGDGKSDILWRNSNGDVGLWVSNSTAGVNFTSIDLGIIPTSWTIEGVGDFTGGGKSDILWRSSAGDVGLWLFNPGSGYTGYTGVDLGVTSTSWTIEKVGDFNGDGKADILMENSNGDWSVWMSNSGSGYTGFTAHDLGILGASWHVA